MKKFLKIMLILTILGCIAYLVYVHRNVIKALINGEELPEMPLAHCCDFSKCCRFRK